MKKTWRWFTGLKPLNKFYVICGVATLLGLAVGVVSWLSSPAALTQTMTNSPGGIQAGGNVTIGGETKTIQTAQIALSVESDTEPRPVSDGENDLGEFVNKVELRTEKTKYRFTSTKYYGAQVAPMRYRRRLMFIADSSLTGQPILALNDVRFLALDPDLMKPSPGARNESTRAAIIINGTSIDLATVKVPPDPNTKDWGTVNIADEMHNFDGRLFEAIKKTATTARQ